ncbi:MAG: hypothetical protein K5880_14760 [Hydrogenophaga sp.]|uniref:ATP-binding protein n=1 Tax=Hydrogenophaga sp. TaxID=1904254 RepID=UPI002607CD7E|nr:ATP-binding protein [Hydrogenophaga sp.]MCV0439858.1 hypothetical protein [Hydrogenophaga sp.]
MKITEDQRVAERSGTFQEQGFRIAANAGAFEILSSKLYTDVITAIIRELSTNAADAHTMAGREDMPFDVHLPNSMNPYFSIRDYGVSLSEEQIINVYTVYFESLNRESEVTTGGFGLGSKSPFAYTDMFAVTAYLNGRARTYSAFKENGEPRIALLTDEPTEEADGIEVRMDIKPGDEWEFKTKAEKVYRFFRVKPNLTGAVIEFPDPKPAMTGDGWEIYNGDAQAAGKVSVVMGNVCYRADRGKFTHKLGREGELVLHVPVGECQPAISREELQYNDVTVAYLQARINDAQDAAIKEIQDSLGHCDTLLEKLIALKQFTNLLEIPVVGKAVPAERKDTYKLLKLELRRGDKLFVGYDRFNDSLRPSATTRYVFVEADVEDTGKIRQKLKNNLRHWIRTQRDADRQAGRQSAVYYLAVIEKPQRFAKILGKPAIKLTEIPDAPRNHNGGGAGGTRTFVKELNCGYRDRLSEKWKSIDSDDVVTDKAIAVKRKGYKVVWNGYEQDPSQVERIANSLGYDTVYGLPCNRYEKLREELDLPDLETQARSHMETFVKTADDFTRAVMEHGNHRGDYDGAFLQAIDGLSDTCSNLVRFLNTENPPREWSQLISQFGLDMPASVNYTDVFKTTYPLVASINLRYAELDDVLEYIVLKETK